MYSKDDLRKLAGIKSPVSPLTEVAKPAVAPKTAPIVETARDPKKSYEGSHEFDGEIAQVEALMKKAKKILLGDKMVQHIKDTKDNFGVDTIDEVREAVHMLDEANKALDKFYNKMEQAA